MNVSVLPMDSERILEHQTVIVSEGKIKAISSEAGATIPEGAERVDGTGKFLMPGLTDMHVHLVTDRRDMFLYVANGVTSVRNMAGFQVPSILGRIVPILDVPDHLELREDIRNEKRFGPTIFTTGKQLDGKNPFKQPWPLSQIVLTPEDAEEAVRQQKKDGFDFVKIYHMLDPLVYERIVKTADEIGIKVVGHVPLKVGLKTVLSTKPSMQSIEHMTGFVDNFRGRLYFPDSELDSYAALMKKSGIWICPTIIVWTTWIRSENLKSLADNENVQYVSPTVRKFWMERIERGVNVVEGSGGSYPAEYMQVYLRVARALHKAGVPFLMGTDSVSPYVIPGFSVHQELKLLTEVGLTPYEALVAATRNPAAALGQDANMGTVEIGKVADLLLLDANPFLNIANAQKRAGVMVQGRWFTQAQLQETLDRMKASF
ncbi:MAG: amidohydrolase family protein [Spirochaetia bacterium]|nr:amidohydrolase family protein [Spirochaetia bacterium]